MSKQRILFIDRDGTLVKEPPVDYQLDALEKLEFYPGAIRNMHYIAKLDFKLVLVSNQDGLGTDSFPEHTFWPSHNMIINTFKNEGVYFEAEHIDPSMPEDNSPARKPGTAMLTDYMKGNFDLENSYVIGDRLTDVQMAKNLGCNAILLSDAITSDDLKTNELSDVCVLQTGNWDDIYAFLKAGERTAEVQRTTKETDIYVRINLDGTGKCDIQTGLGFFDHMLEQIGKHSGSDLTIKVKGDLEVDEHHTIEDTALALGEAIYKAIGDKRGIERYGYALPMDDSFITVALDFGGRPWLVWDAEFKREKVGDMPTEMFLHFFKSFSDAAKCNLYIKAEGDNEHHKIEGIFKALARSIKMAVKRDVFKFELPSTKGVL
ncbi:bifunctional histidinol-phosphatase/imidazoleglycerol-phosphate dehydratase HisB [Saccharicrinis sp. FJH62]|uniref:bifunctional histidinol-phosphatase/imidazoleglycerol-phosphate dehydratase HisB n=1 Tax=Saccharicrinis sp. FJH62 TaxID=3344657 RepID=UPI0035D4042F